MNGAAELLPVQGETGIPPGLVEVLDRFVPITLEELGRSSLLDRLDRKYILPLRLVPSILEEVLDEYRVLEVAGERLSAYRTIYYDTPAFTFYHDHHAGRFPRFKVRHRTYLSTGEEYIEAKRKSRGGRTQKLRYPSRGADPLAVIAAANPFSLGDSIDFAELSPVLAVDYRRATLSWKGGDERVTVDTFLECQRKGRRHGFPDVAILEVKQSSRTDSPIVRTLRERRLRSSGISKYCLCMASIEPTVKTNRFKPVLAKVARAGGAPVWPV